MGEIGFDAAIELAHLAHDPREVAGIEAAAAPGDGVEMKPFRLDRAAVAVDPGGDMHLEARVAGRARHRQAVGDEIPILGHEIDDARRRPVRAGCRQAGIRDVGNCR